MIARSASVVSMRASAESLLSEPVVFHTFAVETPLMVPPVNGSSRPWNQVVVLLRPGERHDAGEPALEELRELPAELPLEVQVVVARIQVELPARKGRRRHARDGIRRDEQRVLERHGVDVVLEERRRDLQVEVGHRVGELKPGQYVLRVVVNRFRNLDVAATAATAKDGAKRATAFSTLMGIGGKGFPVRRQREIEACPASLPGPARGQRPAVDEIARSMFACVVFASVVPPGRSPLSVRTSLPTPSHNEW